MRKSVIDKITSVAFSKDIIIVNTDKEKYQWKIADISERLLKASATDRNNFTISHSGCGIHSPGINEDLSINSLLAKDQ